MGRPPSAAGQLWSEERDEEEVLADATFGPASLRQFDVELTNFTGPFDLLLRLIARRDLDLTEVALASVTDEFLAYIRRQPDLSSATDFLVVAATLLHMKALALLPSTVEDAGLDEDLEARDLLFARLLQYKAVQQVAQSLWARWNRHAGAYPRLVPLEEPYASMLPELRWTLTPPMLASLASEVMAEKTRPDEAQHVGHPGASFDTELSVITQRLQGAGAPVTFASLIADAANTAVVVTRFLALLQLYRQGNLVFSQTTPMGALDVAWVPEGSGKESAQKGGNSVQ